MPLPLPLPLSPSAAQKGTFAEAFNITCAPTEPNAGLQVHSARRGRAGLTASGHSLDMQFVSPPTYERMLRHRTWGWGLLLITELRFYINALVGTVCMPAHS